MRECKNCEYCSGFNYDDGTPVCNCDEDGYEDCPYNDSLTAKEENNVEGAFSIKIDGTRLTEYITNTVENTIHDSISNILRMEIARIVNKYEGEIEKATKAEIGKVVDAQIKFFMEKEITIGGGWNSPPKTLTREQYLGEKIESCLAEKCNAEAISKIAKNAAEGQIGDFTNQMKKDINNNLKAMFDEATRRTLTDNVVSLLMANETYQKLANGMAALLPEKRVGV